MLTSQFRFTGAVIMSTTYGHTVTTFKDDKFVRRIFASAARFAGSLAPGEFMVDVFPWYVFTLLL